MHLELRHLRLVLAIAETGSVTRAAERLHLTQSAVSHQLRDIEDKLGAQLFLRSGKRMLIAAAGERVLESARRILGEIECIESDIAGVAGTGPEGLLRLTTECYTCYHWLPDVLTAYRAECPRVEVRVVPEFTRRPYRALAAGEVDVAIVSRERENRHIGYTPLFQDEFVAVMRPDHPLAGRPYARPSDFEGEPLVLYTMPDESSTLLHEILRPAGVRPGPIVRVQLTEAIIELVKAGVGMTALAQWSVAPHVAAGTLATIPLRKNGYRRTWQAAISTRTTAPSHVTTFLRLLRAASFDGPRVETPGTVRRLAVV